MALGVPLVSTAERYLGAKKDALVRDESVNELAQYIATLLKNPALRAALAKEALDYVKTWSASSMATKQEEYCRRVIQEAANR
jgi:glycosyltransferase involved in cell wall biosynthesis